MPETCAKKYVLRIYCGIAELDVIKTRNEVGAIDDSPIQQ
jgi:hypothetical protein